MGTALSYNETTLFNFSGPSAEICEMGFFDQNFIFEGLEVSFSLVSVLIEEENR